MPSAPGIYAHLRPAGADVPDGVYRVVGTSDDHVTLLRVGDEDGRRVTTGDVVTVDRDALSGFESADNPDGNRPIGAVLASVPRTLYWQLRAFGKSLVGHPKASILATAVLAAGMVVEDVLKVGEPLPTVLVFGGAFGLAWIGSGRL